MTIMITKTNVTVFHFICTWFMVFRELQPIAQNSMNKL